MSHTVSLCLAALLCAAVPAVAGEPAGRALWGSINGRKDATKGIFSHHNNKILLSWRKLPGDGAGLAFDLYRTPAGGREVKVNAEPIAGRYNYQDATADRTVDNTYRLTYHGSDATLSEYTMKAGQASAGLPYISVPLATTTGVNPTYDYLANDASVGDLDGDGICEIVLKRLVSTVTTDGGEGAVARDVRHTTLFEAYRLDGTFMWRVCSGPNIPLGNSASFAVADFDGDGRAEVAMRTSEGTVFGDGTEIGDTDGDGLTDYRVDGSQYIPAGPEFISVIDGASGRELARADYIARGTSEEWGDSNYKRASSYRIGTGCFDGERLSVLITRGVYGKSVLEAWDYSGGELRRRWRFDSSVSGQRYYSGQGYHSLSVGDVDGDGFDEVVYGSCTIDHDGTGLNCIGLGHGDALHLGKFDPAADGLQIWSCFETGSVGAALRDARTGRVIWQHNDDSDVGRACVADIDPRYPGCEVWWFRGNAHSIDGRDLGYKPASCNMAVWFSGELNRQLLNGTRIDAMNKEVYDRVFTVYRYGVSYVNGTKENPCWYGDMLGDWREELIFPDTTFTKELRIFSTWYPTEHSFPWLMTDHVYHMSAINQNIGYNMPTQLGYYLGSDLTSDDDIASGIEPAAVAAPAADGPCHDLGGRIVDRPGRGVYIRGGKKYVRR